MSRLALRSSSGLHDDTTGRCRTCQGRWPRGTCGWDACASEGHRSEATIVNAEGGPDGLAEWGYPAVLLGLRVSAPVIPGTDGGSARKTSISPTSSIMPSNGLVAREPAGRTSPAR